MKFSTPTVLAILVSASLSAAAPSAVTADSDFSGLVKKSDVSNALSLIEELGHLKQKRAFVEDELELAELSKRADSLLSQLLTELENSGLISKVWSFLTTDSDLRDKIIDLVKDGVSLAITKGPALIEAVYESGYLQKLFSYVYNNSSLRSTLLSVAKTLFSSGLNLLKAFVTSKTSSTTTTTAVSTATAAAKRDLKPMGSEEYYDKRDLLDVASSVATAIKNSGLVSSLVEKALADPSASISLLTTVLSKGLVVAEDIYDWSKDNGLLASGLAWIESNGSTYASAIASFLGAKIASGDLDVSDVDSATTTASSATATASTTAAVTAVTAVTVATTATTTATTLVKRRLY